MNAASRQPSTLPADALLAVDGVSLEYRTRSRVVRATQRVSFEVDPADRFVLLGPSGCGKSTLLKAVAGFITPSEGEIRLQGQAVRAPGPDRIVVFQEFDQLPPWKTVRQNVLFPLRVSGQVARDEAERRADECLEKVGLAGFAEAYPHTLSGGMKARVAIARALAMSPDYMLFDEATSALDPQLVGEVLDTMRLLAEEGMTMVLVTHEIRFARDVSDRVAFFRNGLVHEIGTPDQVIGNPQRPETVEFLRSVL